MFGLELLLIPLVVAFSAPVVAAVSAVVAAPIVVLSPLTMVII